MAAAYVAFLVRRFYTLGGVAAARAGDKVSGRGRYRLVTVGTSRVAASVFHADAWPEAVSDDRGFGVELRVTPQLLFAQQLFACRTLAEWACAVWRLHTRALLSGVDRLGGGRFILPLSSICRSFGQQISINGPPQKRLATVDAFNAGQFVQSLDLIGSEEG